MIARTDRLAPRRGVSVSTTGPSRRSGRLSIGGRSLEPPATHLIARTTRSLPPRRPSPALPLDPVPHRGARQNPLPPPALPRQARRRGRRGRRRLLAVVPLDQRKGQGRQRVRHHTRRLRGPTGAERTQP